MPSRWEPGRWSTVKLLHLWYQINWRYLWLVSGRLHNIGYSSKAQLKLKSHQIPWKTHLPVPTYFSVTQLFWNFAQGREVILPCCVQNFKTIGQLKRMLWTKENSHDFSLRWVLDRYPILTQPWSSYIKWIIHYCYFIYEDIYPHIFFHKLTSAVTDILTHCGLVTPYGNTDLGQHWLR